MTTLNEFFLQEGLRNAWIKHPDLKIYMRKGRRIINRKTIKVVDIANVSAFKRGQGHFTKFLDELENRIKNHFDAIFIENVMDERFKNFFLKHGYEIQYENNGLTCLIKYFK